jgi:hypothetical protein
MPRGRTNTDAQATRVLYTEKNALPDAGGEMNETQDDSKDPVEIWHKPSFTRLKVNETAGGGGADDEANIGIAS